MKFVRQTTSYFLSPFLFTTLLTVVLITPGVTPTAQADISPVAREAYCSITANDGNWAFSFAQYSTYSACRTAENALRAITYSPLSYPRSGYYDAYGHNRVYARCRYFSRSFFGYGIRPLQDAYNSALYSRAEACVFHVSY